MRVGGDFGFSKVYLPPHGCIAPCTSLVSSTSCQDSTSVTRKRQRCVEILQCHPQSSAVGINHTPPRTLYHLEDRPPFLPSSSQVKPTVPAYSSRALACRAMWTTSDLDGENNGRNDSAHAHLSSSPIIIAVPRRRGAASSTRALVVQQRPPCAGASLQKGHMHTPAASLTANTRPLRST